jgi:hypothetical protein
MKNIGDEVPNLASPRATVEPRARHTGPPPVTGIRGGQRRSHARPTCCPRTWPHPAWM